MKEHKESIDYKLERDVVFIFGAGASIADGAPLQGRLLAIIMEIPCNESSIINDLHVFIRNNFHIKDNCYPSLESVFGFFDYFISKKESLGGIYTTIKLIELREVLTKLIHQSISNSDSSKRVYRKFWEKINTYNKNISVITLNYDTLLDEAFDFLYPDKALIDYCINFMNYEQYHDIGAFNWWIDPRKPISIYDNAIPTPIKIIKIHGSLNWKYCNCCNQVLLTPWDTKFDVESLSFKYTIGPSCESPTQKTHELLCPNDNTQFDTFIIPPSHIKNLNHPTISKLFEEAALEIRKAKKIVFVGYSFPDADVHIKALIHKNIKENIEIEVIDPSMTDSLKSNYMGINPNVKFTDKTFENYIDDMII